MPPYFSIPWQNNKITWEWGSSSDGPDSEREDLMPALTLRSSICEEVAGRYLTRSDNQDGKGGVPVLLGLPPLTAWISSCPLRRDLTSSMENSPSRDSRSLSGIISERYLLRGEIWAGVGLCISERPRTWRLRAVLSSPLRSSWGTATSPRYMKIKRSFMYLNWTSYKNAYSDLCHDFCGVKEVLVTMPFYCIFGVMLKTKYFFILTLNF